MSHFSFPILSFAEITAYLSDFGIAALKQDDLANPTADLVGSVYSSFLSYLDPIGGDPGSQIDFSALELLENPDHHVDAIRAFNLYHKVKDVLSSIHCGNFLLRDLLKPEPKRTAEILSGIINFLLYRLDKLEKLQPIADELSSLDERHGELDAKISKLNRELLDHEVACEMEEPIFREIDTEVIELQQTIHSLNKEQMSLKAQFMALKEKNDAINDKISQADFELVTNAQENSKLLSKVVQSPEKLQRALEEKKSNRSEVKNAERSAMLSVQERTTTLEVYSKTCEKMSRHFTKVQAVQDQVNSAKNVEKEVKALKATLSDEGVTNMSLEAKIVERQGKVKQVEELAKAMERERDLRHTENTKKLNDMKSEMEWKLQCLEPRERKAEALVAKGENVSLKADSVRESGKAKQQELLAKSEEIINEFRNYSNSIDPFLGWIELEVEKGNLATGIEGSTLEVARRIGSPAVDRR